jgi:uncharacterized membrane protein YphA (DoxX/SURF4 family)
MNMISVVGRILLVLVFVVSGAFKLTDINSAAEDIKTAVVLPSLLIPYMTQLEVMTGFTTPQILAIVAGCVELICGVLIIFNIGTRWFAFVLILFTLVTTYYFHDFWNAITPERLAKVTALGPAQMEKLYNILQAMKNVSIIGALLLLIGQRKPTESDAPVYENDILRH